MTSEVELDLASIRDEDMLRRMWQQTEDFGRKKEIRAHMYKLREARLKNFYTTGDMDARSGIGLTKTPLTPSHGESLVDQSFQSFKTKEIRDSESPTHEIKYTTRPSGVIVPDTSGWNVVTSSEVSPDGKAYKTETLATTEGVKKLSGGHSQFAGLNEQTTQESHEGDDRNYVRKAGESSKTQLQESTVIGDENSGRFEKKSSSVVSSSSHKTTSKFTSSGDDFDSIPADKQQILNQFDQLADSAMKKLSKSSHQDQQIREHQTSSTENRSSTTKKEERHHHHHEERHHQQQQQQHHHQHEQIQNEKYVTEGFTNQDRIQSNQTNINTNRVEQVHEKTPKVTKVYLEEEVNKLAALPGTVISRKIDYPDANTKLITETKELPDGTIVTTKRYETKSAKAKTWQSDSRDEQKSTSRTYHEDRSQNKYLKQTDIQDRSNRRIHDTDNTNRCIDRRTSNEFKNEADRRASEIRRDDIQKQNVQQQKTHHEQVSRNESFQKHETHSVHKEEVQRHDSNIRDRQIRDTVDRATTDTTDRYRDQVENLKDQVENISVDSSHRTVKKDLSQKMRNEKITSQDFIETEKGCYMTDHVPRRPDQTPSSDQQFSSQIKEHTETTKTVRRDSDFTTHGFPSQKPQDTHPRHEDFTTHGFPSVGPQKPSDKHYPHGPKDDFTTHGYPSARPQTDSTKQVHHDHDTRRVHETYSTNHETTESKTHRTQPSTDFTTNGFPSVKPQKYVQEPIGRRPSQTSTTDRSVTEEYYTTKHHDQQQKHTTNIRQENDFTTQGYPSTKPQDHPEHHRPSGRRESPANERVVKEQYDRHSAERHQTEFETYGFPSTKPQPKSKKDDFIGTHGYPSVPRHIIDDQKFTGIADDTSSVTTEQTDIHETSKTHSSDYTTSSRITVEVDAAHEAFARSLRCVSPVDQQRPASSKSIRTSSGSVRSSISPDKRSHRSPSRESGTYSESSRISSSTVTKPRGVDSTKKPVKKTTSPIKQPLDFGSTTTKKISESRKSNETVDVNKSKFDRHDVTSRSFKKTSEEKYASNDYPGEKKRKSKEIFKPYEYKSSNLFHKNNIESPVQKKSLSNIYEGMEPVVEEPCRKKYVAPLCPTLDSSNTTSIACFGNTKTKPSTKPSLDTKLSKNITPSTTSAITRKIGPSTYSSTSTNKKPSKKLELFENYNSILSTVQKTPSKPSVIDIKYKTSSLQHQGPLSLKTILKPDGDFRSPYSSPERPVNSSAHLPSKPITTTKTTKSTEPFYDAPKSNRKVSPQLSPDRLPGQTRPSDTKTPSQSTKSVGDTPKRSGIKPQVKRHNIPEDEGFGGESPRSVSPTATASDVEYIHNVSTIDEHQQVTDLDASDITVEVNLKHIGRDVNLIGTVGDDGPRHTYNQDFISKEKKDVEINKARQTTKKEYDTTEDDVTHEKITTEETTGITRGPKQYPQENGYYEQPSERPYTQKNETKPEKREPFFLAKQHERDDEPKKPEEVKKPKTKPVLTRSETYEERCLKILGIDRTKDSTDVSGTTSHRETSTDFITKERENEEITKTTKTSATSSRSTSPRKVTQPDYETDIITSTTKTKEIVSERDDIEKTYDSRKLTSRSQSPSPVRRSKAPTRETSPSKVGDRPNALSDESTYFKKRTSSKSSVISASSRSPYSSPSRKSTPKDTPNETPQTRSPAVSPVRTSKAIEQSPKGYTSRPQDTCPSKQPSEKISTIKTDSKTSHTSSVSSATKKETIVKDKTIIKDRSPERPNHITTAKIQLSPSLTRKTSTPEMKKNPKSPDTKSKPSSATSTIRETTVTQQKTYSRPVYEKPTSEKLTTRPTVQKKDQTPVQPVQKTTTEKKVITKFERSKTDSDKTINQKITKSSDITSPKKPSAKKIPVIERKETAPVYRTIEQQKYIRSTSENLIKTSPQRTKPEIEVSSAKSPRKNSTDKPRKHSTERRPSKCMTTKTINLTTNTLINSEDMENVIIDIQQAKSSREPSPNKIVPTPVPLDEDTGMPRYPDRVQEPEEQPRRSKVKNIPIFEEESKEYVGCQITEVENVEEEEIIDKRKTSSTHLKKDYETTTTTRTRPKENSPVKEDLRRPVFDETDECLLSVHDKVSKFITTAEEVKKPKSSTPFRREESTRKGITEPDDCLLSVTDKVAKFLNTAENVTKPMTSSIKRVERTNIDELDEDLKKDECVLSVSEKVNKFTTTVEKLTEPYQPKSAELVAQIDRQMSRSYPTSDGETQEEIEKSLTTINQTEKYTPQKQKPEENLLKPSTLKSTEVVKKAKSVFERGNVFTSTPSTPRQRDILSRPSVWEGRKATTDVKLQDIGIYKKDDESDDEIVTDTVTDTCRIKSTVIDENKDVSKPKHKTTKPLPILPDTVSSKKNIFENKISTNKSNVQLSKITKIKTEVSDRSRISSPTSKSRPVESPKKLYDKPVSSRSPERPTQRKQSEPVEDSPSTITKKTKHTGEYEIEIDTTDRFVEDYDSISKKKTLHRDVSPRPLDKNVPTKRVESPSRDYLESPKSLSSPKTPKTQTPVDYVFLRETSDMRKETKTSRFSKTPESVSAKRSLFEKTDVAPTTNESRPSYMDHTVSSLEHRRDSIEITKVQSRRSSAYEITETRPHDGNAKPTEKFGVELRRTNSKDGPRRKSSCPEIPHVEDIFDLELLEQMLNTVVGYEQRRRIRTQIRLVKKIMETQSKKENQTLHKTTVKKTEHITSNSRASSKSPDRYRSPSRSSESTQIESNKVFTKREEHSVHSERSVSPVSKVKTVTTTVEEIRKVGNKPTRKVTTTTEVTDGKPIWATKNILKKASENTRVTKPVSVSKSTATSRIRTQKQQVSTAEEDCITSSYGIGPTDEDGRPLFGIRALKKKSQPGETTKVTGKVITEKYYSENGSEPVGERSVTVYSTNPEDIDVLEEQIESRSNETVKKTSRDGVTTITKTKKIGKQQAIEDDKEFPAITNVSPKLTSTTRTTPKIVRKGSVKEISEKFIRKESSSSVTEKTSSSSYPKAGLILRAKTHSSKDYEDEDLMDYEDPTGECDIEITTTRKHSRTVLAESDSETESVKLRRKRIDQSTRSFLNTAGSKVTGVSDVLDRMRNADNVVEDGDTPEDQEARALLNKFLGASVLMSGVESIVPTEVTTTSIRSSPNHRKQEVKTTRITKTIKKEDSSSPVTRKTCDIEEIFDEELLKKLLEQSTSVEERRKIRARIRQLMAEREAHTNVVASIKAELHREEKTLRKQSLEKKTLKQIAQKSSSVEEEEVEEYDEEDIEEEEEIEDAVEDNEEEEGEESEEDDKQDSESIYEDAEVLEEIDADVKSIDNDQDKEEEEDEEEEVEEEENEENDSQERNNSNENTDSTEEDDDDDDKEIVEEEDDEKEEDEETETETTVTIKLKSAQAKNPIIVKDDLKPPIKENTKTTNTTKEESCTTETTETKEEDGAVVKTTTKVTTRTVSATAPKPVSPFAKFRQLDKQNSVHSPSSPLTPSTPGGSNRGAPIFRFTDPALNARAATVKEQLLQWCQMKTKEYENVQISNFSTSWTDGLAFCALIHHFLPDAFDYSKLTPKERRHNFELAFRVADEKAGIAPLLDVEDMVVMKRPDWKCVFTYVQSIYRRFRNCE